MIRTFTFAVIVLLFVLGIWWGLPGGFWAPDELTPDLVRDAVGRGFSGGWSDKYPPLQYYILAVVQSPIGALARAALGDGPNATAIELVVGRLVSVAMAVGIAICAYLIGRRFWDAHTGVAAACFAAAFLPMPFYAKTANLDVPYLFWFILSLVSYARLLDGITRRPLVLFMMTATLAVCTKDQAYGLYVLPVIHIFSAITMSRQDGTWTKAASIGIAIGTGLFTFVLCHNMLLNPGGFLDHVRTLLGPASRAYRMFPQTAYGQLQLANTSAGLLTWMLGWAGAILAAFGLIAAIRARSRVVWLLLPIVSYYFTFIAVVGYVYDRFLLPATIVMALFAGAAVGRAVKRRVTSPVRILTTIALIWIVWRAFSVDVLLIADSRYAVEPLLQARAADGATIAYVGDRTYLPRMPAVSQAMPASIEATLERNPDLIVVNAEYSARYRDQPVRAAWWEWLTGGAAPYTVGLRRKTRLRWSLLSYDKRFYDGREDTLTNIDKANPEIVVFYRRGQVRR